MSPAAIALGALLSHAAPPSVAVLPVPAQTTLGAVDVDDALRAGIDDDHARLVPSDVVDGVLQRARAEGLHCDPGVVDCAARLGAFGGFDFVVVPAVQPAGHVPGRDDDVRGGPLVTVMLVDCATGRTVRAASGPVAAAPDEARRGLRALAHAALTADDKAVSGTLQVDGNGNVVVDGVERGAAPLSLSLPAGLHVVGGPGRARRVAVPVASTVSVVVVDDGPAPWPALGVAAAFTGAALAAGGVVAALAVAPDPARRVSTSAAAYNDAVTAGRALLVVAGAGVALGGAGIAVWATRSEP